MPIKHIGFIMDGNRRFAKRLMLEPWKGHEYGEKRFREVLEWLREFDIKEATFYAFSKQNFNRPPKEFSYLMDIFRKLFANEQMRDGLAEHRVRVRFAGELEGFPDDVQELARDLAKETVDNDAYLVNVAFGYGGRDEIIQAVRALSQQVKAGTLSPDDIDETTLNDALYVTSEPDLIIRTGGDRRTSNFLPWQSVYAEWCFVDKMWPEFSKEDLKNCIDDFESRERRFGQ